MGPNLVFRVRFASSSNFGFKRSEFGFRQTDTDRQNDIHNNNNTRDNDSNAHDSDIIISKDSENNNNNDSNYNKSNVNVYKPMQIFVKPIFGRTFTLVGSPADSIASVKESIYKIDGTPPLLQRLVMSSRPLEDHSTLQNYRLERECTIHVTLRLQFPLAQTLHLPCLCFRPPDMVSEEPHTA